MKKCDNKQCKGPYAPSDSFVCHTCAEYHDMHPSHKCQCDDCNHVAEVLYVKAMQSGERERRDLPVDMAFWKKQAAQLPTEQRDEILKKQKDAKG